MKFGEFLVHRITNILRKFLDHDFISLTCNIPLTGLVMERARVFFELVAHSFIFVMQCACCICPKNCTI